MTSSTSSDFESRYSEWLDKIRKTGDRVGILRHRTLRAGAKNVFDTSIASRKHAAGEGMSRLPSS